MTSQATAAQIADTLFFLSAALTGKPESELTLIVPHTHIEQLVQGEEFYLPDGGYSRIVVSLTHGNAFLTDNSRQPVKEAWSRCKELVADLEAKVLQARKEDCPDYEIFPR